MRLFFALQPEASTALAIADWRDRHLACNGKTVPPTNFHITLAFLGELPQSSLEQLCDSVDHALQSKSLETMRAEQPTQNTLSLNTLGYWPRPGIFWLGPDTWPPQLERLANKLRGVAQRVGGKRDRNQFQPHITLYRGIGHPPAKPATAPEIIFQYGEFSLFESRLGKNGVSYHSLCTWSL